MVLTIPSARLPVVENSKKISINNKTERKIKYPWKYSGFSWQNNSHQCKDIVNCVVNILSSLGDGSSKVVDANIELNSTNLHFRSLIVFIFWVSWNLSAPVQVFIRLCEYLKGIVKLL